jgi:site-specific DNA-methyltransferase (adenine-specific)
MKPITENTLFYGDNLFILREHILTESVDLIYLDPRCNSSRYVTIMSIVLNIFSSFA